MTLEAVVRKTNYDTDGPSVQSYERKLGEPLDLLQVAILFANEGFQAASKVVLSSFAIKVTSVQSGELVGRY